MNSNMGRLYLMTTDGLFVASVFQDQRAGAESLPAEAKRGSPLGGVSMGSEWFGGYFFKSNKTNEYYLVAGGTAYNLIKLNGLDTLRPLEARAFEVTAAQLAEAQRLIQQRAAEVAAPPTLTIARLPATPTPDGKLDEFPKDGFVEWSAGQYRIRGAVAVDGPNLCLAFDVKGDANPMVNGGQDWTQLFATGDSVNLELGADPAADPKRAEAAPGDLRLLISVLEGKSVAVLYRWKVKDAARNTVTFTCPWRKHTVDDVVKLAEAQIGVARGGGGYTVEALVPLKSLGFDPQAGRQYKLDLGVIFSDATGNNRAARVCWSNKATGLVADIPGEIMAAPNLWGTATLAQ